ncbi:RNA-binding protein [Chryseobacterium vrystaatense]|uniref:Uncharacterized protein n=1 Tax=Chryseobacterium vrystaatense TaxID=307480 RepID=A0ABR4UFI9_9FLAO|nr:hypothetical protein [Chryseobacterium vrystaatense]KFF23266.1 hypothetical protein IW16_23515 [Chryseobacterium vrystaatense]
MYAFLNLKHQEISESTDAETVFQKTEEVLSLNNFIAFTDPAVCLETELNYRITYYVIHDRVVYKGKKKIIKGKIVLSTKKDLLDYVRNQDIRPIRIMPEQNEDFVIVITDEGSALLFTK